MARPAPTPLGLERVIGQTARGLTALFGNPIQDLSDGGARKLQFSKGNCVLDVYLYPKRAGGEPVVTHVDARRPTGAEADRAACVAAMAPLPVTPPAAS